MKSNQAERHQRPGLLASKLFHPRQLAAALLLAGATSVAIAQNAVVVNGTAISEARLDAFVKAMVAQGRPDTPELRQAVRDELIARELFVQEAAKRKLEDEPDVNDQLVRARQDILIGALIRDTLDKDPVSEEQIKAEYDRMVKTQTGNREYRARHILVDTEDEASKIIAELKAGKDFAELAKVSKDPGSAARGGDLDWNTPSTFAPEFASAMTALKKGEFTQTPVKTQFGYHVILLEDTRDAEPPSLDSVRAQVRQQLERQRVVELQQSLRDAASIE